MVGTNTQSVTMPKRLFGLLMDVNNHNSRKTFTAISLVFTSSSGKPRRDPRICYQTLYHFRSLVREPMRPGQDWTILPKMTRFAF